jgi:hypothetical protein
MARNRNLKLFENAVPLAGAWVKFAPAERQLELERTSGFGRTLAKQPVADNMEGLMGGLRTSFLSWQARQKLIAEMRDWLLDELFNNQLIALGVRKLPTKGYSPVVIDPDYFDDAEIDWDYSTVKWHSLHYVDVRVADQRDVAKHSNSRRGSIDQIDRAIRELRAANRKFGKLIKKEAHAQIYEKLGQKYERGNGLSPQNLSKRINAICGKRSISKNI